MNMSRQQSLAQLQSAVGKEVRVSDWLEITQRRVDAFAAATDDYQWIHCDPVRAAKDSPYGGTIAHGYLTLALYTKLRVGARLRARVTLEAVEEISGGLQFTEQYTAEIEGSNKPACVADVIMRLYV